MSHDSCGAGFSSGKHPVHRINLKSLSLKFGVEVVQNVQCGLNLQLTLTKFHEIHSFGMYAQQFLQLNCICFQTLIE
jgi:hypothetical protein